MKPVATDAKELRVIEELKAENQELRLRLEEAEETIAAIRGGLVDALVVEEPQGHRIYTLEGAERPYRLFVEEMQQGAATLHPDGTIAWSNQQLATLLQVPQEKLLGLALLDFVTFESKALYSSLFSQGQSKTGRGECYLHRADGGSLPVFLTFNALPKDCGAAIGVLVTDLTPQKHHEQLASAQKALQSAQVQLQQYARELETRVADRTADLTATNEQLETFIYSMAHDLRAPLRAMSGFSHLLVSDYGQRLDEPAQQMLKRIHASSEFMDKLLLDLLAFGRIARIELELTPVPVEKAWEIALFQCAAEIDHSHAKIISESPLPTVLAHEPTLAQCLANLLSNALKFVAPDVQPRVRFHAEERDTGIRLWLEDNGVGIPDDQTERVFRVFERLHGARYTGTGIGLSIVRKGIERMGGHVGVESSPAGGSRFWIDLQRAH